ncbi:T9SS type A sorting domain-containing protein [Persicobacter psychrovividus]|uniref:Por secretion system C-terminal sorting domain-containing protein n=1 Tax=Persicobacter psychrovividus TaxID=387638 RepID=A0ABM7VA83_9BACT|nr:hypothetical protein PEPS_01090 [Persicobacter psychrovividus]
MKKIFSVMIAMMMSAAVFAGANDNEAAKGKSMFRVIANNNAELYKVIYIANKTSKVKISIYDEDGAMVVSTVVKGVEDFMKPFRFKRMPAGTYTVVVRDGFSVTRKTFEHKP